PTTSRRRAPLAGGGRLRSATDDLQETPGLMQPGVSPMQDWGRVVSTWKATLEAVQRVGGYTTLEAARSAGIRHSKMWGLTVEGPASLSDIRRIETDLGIGLPPALSRFFLEFSRSVDFRWQLPPDFLLPEQFR